MKFMLDSVIIVGNLLILLESSILANCKQFWFVDGANGVATLIIGVQAIKYTIFVICQITKDLLVSLIEFIKLVLNMIVVVVHNMVMLCENSLVIYLTPKQDFFFLIK
jgi:hypothetical protein